uniref:Uncharacterized protein n=1 Tax=Leptobrachium leishanense TaxID=445787 RepID=A0A8C5LPY1_9ANUR
MERPEPQYLEANTCLLDLKDEQEKESKIPGTAAHNNMQTVPTTYLCHSFPGPGVNAAVTLDPAPSASIARQPRYSPATRSTSLLQFPQIQVSWGQYPCELRPTPLDKILVWGGHYKKQDIPEILSCDVVNAAKSKVQVKFAGLMMLMTIFGCVVMVISGKQAAGRHESVASYNLEKKARL